MSAFAPVNLLVPYLAQLDNEQNPYGSCNVTSVAMCMKYLAPGRNFGCPPGMQLEDFLQNVLESHGKSRHSPYDLEWLLKHFGVPDTFSPVAKWGDAKGWLEGGNPLIVHGYFTQSGHIIVIRGYNDNGDCIVNDPYGEWFSSGYRTDLSGENLVYSDELMKRCCGPDGDLWLHFVGDQGD